MDPQKQLQKFVPLIDARPWHTIHIFGFGESQIIGQKINKKVLNSKLKSIDALISHLSTKQQDGTRISLDDLYALNIFYNSFVQFMPRSSENKSQRFLIKDIDPQLINNLSADFFNSEN